MPLEAADLINDPTIKALQGTMGELGKLVRGIVSIQQQQSNVLQEIRTKVAAAPTAHNEKDGDDEDDEEVDVNSLDNGAFQKLLMKQVGGLLDEKLGVFGQKLDGVSTEYRSGKIREEYGQIKKDHPDFDEWADEMKALAKDFPALGLKRLYTLARSENPDKVKELESKFKRDDAKKEDHTLTLFGGFRPTIGKTPDGESGKKVEKMTADEAGAKAWDETVARFPGLASLETNPLD